jgi:GH24 family phage-related lysozyme (muramidase)
MAITQEMINRTKKWEQSVNYMYLDNNGNVTIGIGFKVATADDAVALKLDVAPTGKEADEKAKRAEWNAIHKMASGHPADYYQQSTTLIMKQEDIDAGLPPRLQDIEDGVIRNFVGYSTYPIEVKEALVDMSYTLGITGILKNFPNFNASINSHDWHTASIQSKRTEAPQPGGVQPARNEDIRILLLTAATRESIFGNWIGPYAVPGKQATLHFDWAGSGFSGTITVQGISARALSNISYDWTHRVATFSEPTIKMVFQGSVSADFQQMQIAISQNNKPLGNFNYSHR